MKKIFVLSILTMLLAGCRQEEPAPAVPAEGPVFAAMTEEYSFGTKTSLGADLASVWSAGDEIAIFQGSSSADRYLLDEECAGYSCGNFNMAEAGTGGNSAIPVNLSVYPYQEGLVCSESADGDGWLIEGFSFPSVQYYEEGSFAEDSYAMAAVTANLSDYNLSFRNVGGALKLLLKGKASLTRLTLSGKASEKISGAADIMLYEDGHVPGVAMKQDSGTTVVLDCGRGVALNESSATEFFFSLPPTVFSEGFAIEIESADGSTYVLEATAANTVGRSQILVMPETSITMVPPTVDNNYVDEYGVNRGPGILIDGVLWAPVNCGYKAPSGSDKGYPYGKMYQWGRNSGVGYSTVYDADVAQEIAGGSITIAEANAVENSNIFYSRRDSNPNALWFSDTSYETIWNSGTQDAPVKTANDPCPDGWRVPTYDEIRTLVKNKSAFTTDGTLNGYYYSGSTAYAEGVPAVFLPAGGSLGNTPVGSMRGSFGRYWSSSLNGEKIYYLSFSTTSSNAVYGAGTVSGFNIRCVADNNFSGDPDDGIVEVESIALSVTSLELTEGDTYKLNVTVQPAGASAEGLVWNSSNASVCKISAEGNVEALAAGDAVITAALGSLTAQCTVVVNAKETDEGGDGPDGGGDDGDEPGDDEFIYVDYVDEYGSNRGTGVMVDGTVWAPVNCGYREASPNDLGYPYGKLYQWGRNSGVGYDTVYDASVSNKTAGGSITIAEANAISDSNIFYTRSDGNNMSLWFSDSSYTDAWNAGNPENPVKSQNDPCPKGWRVPTYQEMRSLYANSSEFTAHDGQKGFWYSGKTAYSEGVAAVFLPAAGYLDQTGTRRNRGTLGRYWTSTTYSPSGIYYLSYSSNNSSIALTGTVFGCSIRCVQE